MATNDTYRQYDFKGNYNDYAKERDEHLYQLWKKRRTKDWIAAYIGRSEERARQLNKKFEARERQELKAQGQ